VAGHRREEELKAREREHLQAALEQVQSGFEQSIAKVAECNARLMNLNAKDQRELEDLTSAMIEGLIVSTIMNASARGLDCGLALATVLESIQAWDGQIDAELVKEQAVEGSN
jgi:hypothetical protein